MALFLRPLRLASAAYRHLQDWAIVEDGRTFGRIIEDGSASTTPDRRWSWSIVVYVPLIAWIDGRLCSIALHPFPAAQNPGHEHVWSLNRLNDEKLVSEIRGGWRLTAKGEKELNRMDAEAMARGQGVQRDPDGNPVPPAAPEPQKPGEQ
jgi:hypothetical protein